MRFLYQAIVKGGGRRRTTDDIGADIHIYISVVYLHNNDGIYLDSIICFFSICCIYISSHAT